MDKATPTDAERIERLETEVHRLSEMVEDYEHLTMRVAALEQKVEQAESREQTASFRLGMI